jgi:UDP-N-acetylglucosamine 4,6-dehydratase/5-epimerase
MTGSWNCINNKTILVTGGTGTFGKAFTKNLLETYDPKKIIIFSRDEYKQYRMADEFHHHPKLRFFNGDIRDRERLEMAFKGVDFVVHAAAMKHVPACEYNPFEAVKTNVIGAQNIIEAAINNKVRRVVAISTDKAVAPINLYGSTKLAMERLFLSAHSYSDTTTFGLVRYGNVCGSRGSVIPFFADLVKGGAVTLPVTHEDMTRFNIYIEDGVHLALTSLFYNDNGRILIPRIPSFKIVDLVEAFGKKVELIGIRKGEKIHETLISADETRNYKIWGEGSARLQFYVIDTLNTPYASSSCDGEYSSGANADFLNVTDLKTVLHTLGYKNK